MSKDIVVVIPLHEFNEEVKVMLGNAIYSVPLKYKIFISTTHNLVENTDLNKFVEEFVSKGVNVSLVYEDSNSDAYNKSDFCTLVNNGSKVGHEWFTVLEFDDTYNSIWFDNVEKYMEYMPETSAFLPLTELVDYSNGKFIGYGNEAPWASSFSEEIGVIDNDCLQQYFDFYLTGGVFNSKDWNELGGLKPSIKLTFWYEFLLRMTHNGKKIYVIPKLGYNHMLNREKSLYDVYQKTVNSDESQFWLNVAKQDYFYKTERDVKTYTYDKK